MYLTKHFLFTGSDASISVWDMDSLLHVDSTDEPGNQIGAMDFTSDGISFATAGKVCLCYCSILVGI